MPHNAMTSMDVVGTSFSAYFRAIQARVHELIEPLSTQELWVRPYAYGNSIGNLILHLTGNLNYYIGARIAGTGYVRHRDEEFTGSGKSKEPLLAEFDAAIEIVVETVRKQTETDWAAPYSGVGTQMPDRFSMVLSCAGHAKEHLGQIIYLQRELLGRRGR